MKICNGYCDNCLLFGKKLTNDSKKTNEKVFYEIDYYLENKEIIKDEKIALIKLDNKNINILDLNKEKILKINYYIKYNDIFDSHSFEQIDKNIKKALFTGIKMQIFIICENINEIINSFKKLKSKYDVDINFYTNFMFAVKKHKELNVTQIIKQDMNKLIDKSICNNEILKKWDFLIEYKTIKGDVDETH